MLCWSDIGLLWLRSLLLPQPGSPAQFFELVIILARVGCRSANKCQRLGNYWLMLRRRDGEMKLVGFSVSSATLTNPLGAGPGAVLLNLDPCSPT